MFSSFVCVPNPRRDVKTVRGPALAGGSAAAGRWLSQRSPAGYLLRLDEDEWVALADGHDLGALADQGGHELQGVAGQGAVRAARDGVGDGLGAFVVGAGATELPAAGRVEGLVEDLRRPRLADGGQVDRRFQN
jgi:hypothetical protein